MVLAWGSAFSLVIFDANIEYYSRRIFYVAWLFLVNLLGRLWYKTPYLSRLHCICYGRTETVWAMLVPELHCADQRFLLFALKPNECTV
jgi:hypothetical protein